jgi:hypothetical protein
MNTKMQEGSARKRPARTASGLSTVIPACAEMTTKAQARPGASSIAIVQREMQLRRPSAFVMRISPYMRGPAHVDGTGDADHVCAPRRCQVIGIDSSPTPRKRARSGVRPVPTGPTFRPAPHWRRHAGCRRLDVALVHRHARLQEIITDFDVLDLHRAGEPDVARALSSATVSG